MDRRGFLARLTAAAAGMAAAARSGGLITAAPQAATAKNIRRIARETRRSLCEAQQQVIDLLRDCRVTGIGCVQEAFGGPTRYAITYRQKANTGLDDGDKPLPYCNLSHHQILDTGAPVSITATYQAETIEPILEVEVVWLLP